MITMQDIFSSVISFFSQYNWIDAVVVIGAILYMVEGYGTGFVGGLFDIIGFLLSFSLALWLHGFVGGFFTGVFHLPANIGNILGFAFIAIVIEIILRLLQKRLDTFINQIPDFPTSSVGRTNQFFGIIPGFFSGMILLSFFLTIFVVLPISLPIKQSISNSVFGTALVEQTQSFEKNLMKMFGGQGDSLLTFFTIEPQADSVVKLDFTTDSAVPDGEAENRMFFLLNQERKKQGLDALVMDEKLQIVGRNHANDMLTRGYFSHYTPEGISPFDRMSAANITYQFAGENLAFSPNVDLAMQGLMQSPGHRANILSPNFHKVGIGIMNAGIYGEMFAQEFTD